jgi:hypothetical protein
LLVLATCLVSLPPTQIAAQEQYGFLVRLGADTIAIERVSRTASTTRVELLERSPVLQRTSYEIRWNAGRGLELLEFRTAQSSRAGANILRVRAELSGDSIVARSWRNDTLLHRVAARLNHPPFPWLLGSIAAYEASFAHLRRVGGDSLTVLGVAPAPRTGLVPRTMRTLNDGWFSYPFFQGQRFVARLDAKGDLTEFSGRETTIKYEAVRIPAPDIDALERTFREREVLGSALGIFSPRDTTRATVAGALLTVDYSRPRVRKRVILGELVPLDVVWRTGADAATQFTTDRDLFLCGGAAPDRCDHTLPAGSYTLWTVPHRDGAEIIVNRQTGQWGTSYDSTRNLVRLPLRQRRGLPLEEAFTIRLESAGDGGTLVLRWDDFEWSLPFRLRPSIQEPLSLTRSGH